MSFQGIATAPARADNPPVPTLLAVIPHPDDESYSFGGTIALASRAGWRCVVVCASSGERGKRHDGVLVRKEGVGTAREQELAASCKLLGAQPPRFLRLPDGGLSGQPSRAGMLRSLVDEIAPDVILALGADGAYGHPDHIAVYHWVAEAWRALSGPRPELLFAAFPAGLFLPQYEKCIEMMGNPPSPAAADIGSASFDYEVDIRPVARVKLSAIRAHRSQLPGGDPEALFPAGIVSRLLEVERFRDARGLGHASLLDSLTG
ncbi:MAG: hypothetical protein C0506_03015 [Anaerolinea sp.]|nr:hypothetical protein [Anaerolinea sp.]